MNNETVLKGTYCILMYLNSDAVIAVGGLGEIDFQKGYYVYVGSALNSLIPRIKRHLSQDKKLHWHIDHFLNHKNVEVINVLYVVDDHKWECKLVDEIAKRGLQIKNFGCSDCKCDSHLFYFNISDDLGKYCLDAFRILKLNPEKYLN